MADGGAGSGGEYAALATRVMQPDRPWLAPVQRCAQETVPLSVWEPRELREYAAQTWEALAARGLVPLDWVGDEGRAFHAPCEACSAMGPRHRAWGGGGGGGGGGVGGSGGEDDGCDECGGRGVLVRPYPGTLRACMAVASDPRGVATAEALAREVVARLRAWGVPQPRRVVWCCESGREWRRARVPYRSFEGPLGDEAGPDIAAMQALGDRDPARVDEAVAHIAGARKEAEGSVRRFGRAAADAVGCDAAAGLAWELAVKAGLVVRRGPPWLRGRCFALLPDPFAPLLALWRTGYALDAITADAIVLVAPEA